MPSSSLAQLPATATNEAPIPDNEHEADLPLTMMASIVLTSLPRDAHAALASAGGFEKDKGELAIYDSGLPGVRKLIYASSNRTV